MKTKRIKNLGEAQELYGRYTKEAENGGLIVRRCGGNFANLGRSNVIFHLPNWDLLLMKTGAPYIQIEGLPIRALIQDIYPGFSDKARVCLGVDVMRDTKHSTEMHFYTTMDVDQAKYVLIADHQDVQSPHKVADVVKREALHYSQGNIRPERKGVDWEYWDYYILPFYAVLRDENDTCQEIIEDGTRRKRRRIVKSFLHRMFDGYLTAEAVRAPQETRPKKLNPVERDHYDDGLYRRMTFVIDAYGRLLKPHNADTDKANGFIDATVACTDVWDIVPKDHLVVEYIQRGFSVSPIYKILRHPADKDGKLIAPASLQLDRIAILEAQLAGERQAGARALKVDGILVCGPVDSWSNQLTRKWTELSR